MRLETQKQIVKAFSMMYEDTDMPLSELIGKLQELNGSSPQKERKKMSNDRPVRGTRISNEQILNLFRNHGPTMKTRQIATMIDRSLETVREHLHCLIEQGKIKEVKLNPRLSEFTLVE